MESDDLSQLMPNTQRRVEQASPANTAALREYIRVRAAACFLQGVPASRAGNNRPARRVQPIPSGRTHLLQVLGEKRSNVPAASTVPHKPRTDGLQLRGGTGRRPQRRHFIIKFRCEWRRATAPTTAPTAMWPAEACGSCSSALPAWLLASIPVLSPNAARAAPCMPATVQA